VHGNQVHPWTVNTPEDIRFCLDLGVTGLTTDDPEAVRQVLDSAFYQSDGQIF
jgi:glycerophosphoryl diester phosphodiesterase